MMNIKEQILCQKIISGGQTGVDRGVLDACLVNNFLCGGWCPKGRIAEDGPIEEKYPLQETFDYDYDTRTKQNIFDSDGTLIITNENLIGGTKLTYEHAKNILKPVLIIYPKKYDTIKYILQAFEWIKQESLSVLNIAGPRKSEWDDGYDISYQITSGLIYEINNSFA